MLNRSNRIIWLAALPTTALAAALLCGPARAEEFTGKVIKVQDGDSITVKQDDKDVKIVLWAIDAPELEQDFGKKSKEYLASKLDGKTVRIVKKGEDRYKRVIGQVFLEKTDICEDMVKNGYAWAYTKNDDVYKKAETQAKADKKGLWAADKPKDPAEFRKEQREKAKPPTR